MRTINKTKITQPKLEDDSDFASDFGEALLAEAQKKLGANAKAFLLSFHDDGVVWGRMENGNLRTSDELKDTNGKPFPSPSPEFRSATLQECRLFNNTGELLIWRVGEKNFKARWIIDGDGEDKEFFDEAQVLHGTQIDKDKNDNLLTTGSFTVVADGSEGLRHAFPMKKSDVEAKFSNNPKELKRPLRLRVRHYLSYDDGCAYVSLSRLVNVEVEGEKQ